jgi:drug/metabolite transporter (DMT)-like permease
MSVVGLAAGEGGQVDVGAFSWESVVAFVYLVIAGSLIAFTAYAWLLKHAPISQVATYAYVNPVVAVALGALILAEPVTPRVLLGGAVIVVGVALVVSTERPRAG